MGPVEDIPYACASAKITPATLEGVCVVQPATLSSSAQTNVTGAGCQFRCGRAAHSVLSPVSLLVIDDELGALVVLSSGFIIEVEVMRLPHTSGNREP